MTENPPSIVQHDLKIHPEFFNEYLAGRKTFEIRKNDRDFQPGHLLVLREWDPVLLAYTGRKSDLRRISYVTSYGQAEGMVVFGHEAVEDRRRIIFASTPLMLGKSRFQEVFLEAWKKHGPAPGQPIHLSISQFADEAPGAIPGRAAQAAVDLHRLQQRLDGVTEERDSLAARLDRITADIEQLAKEYGWPGPNGLMGPLSHLRARLACSNGALIYSDDIKRLPGATHYWAKGATGQWYYLNTGNQWVGMQAPVSDREHEALKQQFQETKALLEKTTEERDKLDAELLAVRGLSQPVAIPLCTGHGHIQVWACGAGRESLEAILRDLEETRRSRDGWKQDAEARAKNEAHWKERAEAAELKFSLQTGLESGTFSVYCFSGLNGGCYSVTGHKHDCDALDKIIRVAQERIESPVVKFYVWDQPGKPSRTFRTLDDFAAAVGQETRQTERARCEDIAWHFITTHCQQPMPCPPAVWRHTLHASMVGNA